MTLTACRHDVTNPRAQQSATPTAGTQPPSPMLVVYSDRIIPDRLSDDQESEIVKACRSHCPNEKIWFLYVRANRDGDLSIDAYFEPQDRNVRVQHGRVAHLGRSRLALEIKASISMHSGTTGKENSNIELGVGLGVYVYIAPPPGGPPATKPPKGNELPFQLKDNFSDDDLIQIVDCYRSKPKRGVGSNWTSIDASRPILELRHVGEEVELTTGTSEGFMSGYGQILLLRKQDSQWQVARVGTWVS